MALQKVGALWLAEKDGKKYMKGTVNERIPPGSKVFVYRNIYKKEDKHPDYTLHIAADDQPSNDNYDQSTQSEEDPF